MLADVIVDLQYGDCGKGKIASHLCKINDYTHVIRYFLRLQQILTLLV